jgi:hypothetical protein
MRPAALYPLEPGETTIAGRRKYAVRTSRGGLRPRSTLTGVPGANLMALGAAPTCNEQQHHRAREGGSHYL